MARMIPEINPDLIENSGERAAYRAIAQQLPSNWVVRYHYPFCWKDGYRLRDGEADFLVMAPGRGLMVVEVKGSHGFDCRDGKWIRVKADGSEEVAKNPFEQASATMHQIVGRMAKKVFSGKAKHDFPGTFGHLVMYPLGKIAGGLPSSTEPTLMVAYKDMSNLRQRFETAFVAWGAGMTSGLFTSEKMGTLVSFLSDETHGIPVIAASVEEDDLRIEELTRLQFSSFRGLLGAKRVHVSGPAGSGKTLLARWAAQHLADNGERILLTCYNRVLAEWLRRLHGDDSPFEIHSFFSLCRKIVMQAQLPFNPDGQPDFWTRVAPGLFVEALDKLSPEELQRYDGVIVDEGQDFHSDWWFPLLLLLRNPDNGRLCIFSDADQRGVYGKGDAFPANLVPYVLQENCRNTKKIAGYSGNIIGRVLSTSRLQPEGQPPRVEVAIEDPVARSRAVAKAFSHFISEGFLPAQIAILSPYTMKHHSCCLSHLGGISNLLLAGGREVIQEWKESRVVWASTIKSFKGLEADCVILADASMEIYESEGRTELYVGTTRAKHQLVVFPIDRITEEQLKLYL